MSPRTKVVFAHAALIVVALAATAALPPGGDAHPLLQYLGRFHILVLHAPIGVLVVALAGEGLTLTKHREHGDVVVGIALPLLVLTGVAAIVLGLLLAHGETEHALPLIAKHRNFTLAGIVLAGLAAGAYPYRRGRALHRALLAVSTVVLGVGAHFGGSLTHGSAYLTMPQARPTAPIAAEDAGAPPAEPGSALTTTPEVSPEAGAADALAPPSSVDASAPLTDASAPVVAVAVARDAGAAKPSNRGAVQAILVRRCAPCHTEKSKGGLHVTDLGKMKAADVVAGDPDESLLYSRLLLPKDSDDRMPPIDKPQPSAGEIAAIRTWIKDLKSYP